MKKVFLLVATVICISATTTVNAQTNNVTSSTNQHQAKEARNKQTALASFSAYQKGDIDAAFKDYDKGVLFYYPENKFPLKNLDTLISGSKTYYQNDKKTFSNQVAQIVTAVAEDDYVMIMFNDTAIMKGNMGSMKASGKSYNVTDVLVFKFNQDGKIIEQRFILPYSEIRRQVKVGVEYDLNSAGYELIRANKLNDAIEIFKTNVKLYPTSFNTYDSLGEAYALAGNKKLAIENYEKAIKINPSHEYGKKMLSKLKAK